MAMIRENNALPITYCTISSLNVSVPVLATIIMWKIYRKLPTMGNVSTFLQVALQHDAAGEHKRENQQ